ncbi:MAG: cell filamentation protein Fic [Candidatus Raymondbacteria bacterium RifOxyA12_full_50_37]|uniref:Cell filamentation protein Fic n=1 Tax=Candidatus Raymondbacteria bacterium RIFOXYD12_FULL_49_13 TaxID=1817890 RepID=A0A1F7EZD3_UNCRA|nr:MAG: cell filamentation protein Fic [Candidatus Raymondbacteria bacterium RifOxyA12_full_50_37]OGJ88972.1 MAG: cell filamentation protein Fic [Candidatus Raymondbacteria bacterium RIFOXYA2_FULL_49_16]OGJ97000.1 MAG: cell filamentation protein Fic [Candidatus Raymondbacteria bacterium RIFOXYC2_FULL_50_21]OGJ99744.1 MAG: cell filamentation protein Fic [Candidatus Raymondbacteria bacterium RIFOXYD12_FULL_49_13]OGK02545.1 MAG: cell filamentation protein Fic [Candidatus Raymondbacteria bacterium 
MPYKQYNHISQMEPLFTSDSEGRLKLLATTLLAESAALSGSLPQATTKAIASLVHPMNSYYSNLIEGHATNPLDIERALNNDFSEKPEMRALQVESRAHIEVQRLIEARLETTTANKTSICSADFLCFIHKEFYARMPQEYRFVKGPGGQNEPVTPGQFRTREVLVGNHLPPAFASLPDFLKRFAEAYDPAKLDPLSRIIAAAASHHRLAWIHPFLDGNGRVARLFTQTYLSVAGVDSRGLWSIARGLARSRSQYRERLAAADEQRLNDYDGRGNLSDKGLDDFCHFFLETALDQIRFMKGLIAIEGLSERLHRFSSFEAAHGRLRPESAHILREAFLRGTISRGDAIRVTGLPERSGRRILGELINSGLLSTTSPKGPLSITFPIRMAGFIFPGLFPETP